MLIYFYVYWYISATTPSHSSSSVCRMSLHATTDLRIRLIVLHELKLQDMRQSYQVWVENKNSKLRKTQQERFWRNGGK